MYYALRGSPRRIAAVRDLAAVRHGRGFAVVTPAPDDWSRGDTGERAAEAASHDQCTSFQYSCLSSHAMNVKNAR